MNDSVTADDPLPFRRVAVPVPGLLLVWSANGPAYAPYALAPGTHRIGRSRDACHVVLPHEDAVSRHHAEITLDEGARELVIRDDASTHGTFVDGVRVAGTHRIPLAALSSTGAPLSTTAPASTAGAAPTPTPRVLRLARAIFLVCADITPFITDATSRRPPPGPAALLEPDGTILGPAMRRVRAQVADAAKADRPLFVQGESGTGKERVAAHYHASSWRARNPKVDLNCANIEAARAEARLFGWARGAYTGADRAGEGDFQRADTGVLFLDEIAELSLDVQAKLLRVLEDGWVTPLGGERVRVDVAVVCATQLDLATLVAAGRFREDLMRRLRQRAVRLPPIRERREEIPFFVQRFHAAVEGAPPLSPRFIEACLLREWRGNVRTLEAVVDSVASDAATAGDPFVEPDDATFAYHDPVSAWSGPAPLAPTPVDAPNTAMRAPAHPSDAPGPMPVPGPRARTPREIQDDVIQRELEAAHGDVKAVAAKLEISKTAIYNAIQRSRARTAG